MSTEPDDSAAACWARFVAAADAARAGHFAPARALIARIRASSGDYAAQTARRELRCFIGLDNPAFDAVNRRLLPVAEIVDDSNGENGGA